MHGTDFAFTGSGFRPSFPIWAYRLVENASLVV